MKKIGNVFVIIGILVLVFIIWDIVFNENGIIRTVYDAVTNPVNRTWQSITGDPNARLLPDWGDTGADTTKRLYDY